MSDSWRIEKKVVQHPKNEVEPVVQQQSNVSNNVGTTKRQEKKKGGGAGIIVSLLLLILVAVSYFAYTLYKDKKYTENQLVVQKEQMIKELSVLQHDYDDALEVAGKTREELQQAKAKIVAYIDSLKTMKTDIATLWKYRKQVQILTEERKKLLILNDSLRKTTQVMTQKIDSTTTALIEKGQKLDSVSQKVVELDKKVQEGSVLSLRKIEGHGVKESSGGRYEKTDKAKSANKLRICYTVSVNRITEEGMHDFYMQIIDPSGVTLGKNDTFSFEGKTINYSLISQFFYERKLVDVCEYVPAKKEFAKGTYKVKIFDAKLREVGDYGFILK